jgi:hypothetical protein
MAEGIDTLVSMQTILDEIRERTDYTLMKGDDPEAHFIKDSWLKKQIRRDILKLWDFLYRTYGADFWSTQGTVTTVAGEREANLPADFWRLKRIAWQPSGSLEEVPLHRLNMESDPLRSQSCSWSYGSSVGYYLNIQPQGMANQYEIARSKIGFNPIPASAYTLNIYYVPTPQEQVAEGIGRFWNLYGHEEFVILSGCIKVRQKDDGDQSEFKASLAQEKHDIAELAPPFDVQNAETIRDVRSNDEYSAYSFLDR